MEKTFFDQPIKNYIKAYDNMQKITTGQEDDYTTGCFARLQLFQKTK